MKNDKPMSENILTKTAKIRKKILAITMAAACAFSCLAQSASIVASAAENFSEPSTNQEHKLTDWEYNFLNSGLPKSYNAIKATYQKVYNDDSTKKEIAVGFTNPAFNEKYAKNFYYWSDGSYRISYCLQLGISSNDTDEMNKYAETSYLFTKLYGTETADLLKAACIYTFKAPASQKGVISTTSTTNCKYKDSSGNSYTQDVELVASQCIVWAISSKKYFDTSTTGLGTYEKTFLNCITAPNDTKKTQLIDCYIKMKTDILKHYTLSSGTASENDIKTADGKAEVTYTLTYRPSDGKWVGAVTGDSMLEHFSLASNITGVTVTRPMDNVLRFTCTDAGAKALANKTSVKLVKTSAVNASKMDGCSPMIYATGTASTTSQAKLAYYDNSDPVEAYVAFELSTGSFTMDKKLNNTSTSITKSEYITYDKTVGAKLKYTWDKTYKWDDSVSDWVEYKNAPTSNLCLRSRKNNPHAKMTRAKTLGWFYKTEQIKARIAQYRGIISYEPKAKVKVVTQRAEENKFVRDDYRENFTLQQQTLPERSESVCCRSLYRLSYIMSRHFLRYL